MEEDGKGEGGRDCRHGLKKKGRGITTDASIQETQKVEAGGQGTAPTSITARAAEKGEP